MQFCRSGLVARPRLTSLVVRKRTFSTVCQASQDSRKRIAFLGTPDVAALVLDELLTASQGPDASFEVAAVISQPGKPKGRGNKSRPVPTPVEQLARSRGVPDELIMCPRSAKEEGFLEAFAALKPDLAVTAAYGNMLPTAFLSIPTHGTLNIHPSLLPKYRGAAPVQRAVQDGLKETGVSLAFTVLKCDAGPLLAQTKVAIAEDEQAPQLLERCFRIGAGLLLEQLPTVWTGTAREKSWQQEEGQATHAAKLSKEEAMLDFNQPAGVLHNKIRAFTGWPGTIATFSIDTPEAAAAAGGAGGTGAEAGEVLQLKVVKSRVPDPAEVATWQAAAGSSSSTKVLFVEGNKRMLVPCGQKTWLEVLEVQPPTKKVMVAQAFYNGLGGKGLKVLQRQQQPAIATS